MTEKEKEQWVNVAYRMDAEGFHYCFARYSSFREIQDSKFHRLRKAYLKAAQELKDYVYGRNEEIANEENETL